MTARACDECPVKDLQRIHRLLEKRALAKMPEEVREPLLEAKRQMRLVLRGFIGHALREEKAGDAKDQSKSRHIKLD
jgi:hypothetical protein